MNETKRRIAAYKAALPELRERVVAVALLLVLSLTMLASASFAWLTISRAPELSGVATTVAANGNLEIALSNAKGDAPAESQIGDSSATEGRSVVESNLTWGNLVNLSDASYGLDNLTLRPAQLNQSDLLVSPLYGAVFQGDGRVEKLSSSFAYATWQPPKDDVDGYFLVTNDKGVRAISSTTIEAVGFAQQVLEKRNAAEEPNLAAGQEYLAITQNSSWMNSLANIMGIYMTAKINSGQGDESLTNPTINGADLQNLTAIFEAFRDAYVTQTEAMVNLVNYQLFLKNSSEGGNTPYTPYTAEMLLATTEAKLNGEGLRATGLDQMKKDIQTINNNLPTLQTLAASGSVKWVDSGLNTIVNQLVDVGKCTIGGTPINNIGASNAMSYLSGTQNAVITNGILYNFEHLNGTHCDVRGLSISAKAKRMGITVPATVKANIATSAPVPAQFPESLTYSDGLNQGAQGIEIAEDTYALAIDLWVRTNRQNTYLTLEGNVLSESLTVEVIGEDADGNAVDIYTIQRSEEVTAEDGTTETLTIDIDLYKVEDDTTTTWYNATDHSEFTLNEGENPVRKTETVTNVIGYEGENRVWEDAKAWEEDSLLSLDSTTQGSGSCYVYYADTPEDQARSLKLLSGFNVAFIDDKGELLATAIMDTEHYYAENGRVTVPLVLHTDSIDLGMDIDGNQRLAITALEQNVAKRITALVYLDGTKLSNSDVLAASEIQGKLNIQFGSSEKLVNASDEKLLGAELSVSANITSGSSFKYDEAIENGTPMTTTVELNINGDDPEQVTAFFIRQINATQGSREKEMTFTKQADGKWTGKYTFSAPGNYILRSVTLDGNTYDLKECPTVTIEGFTVSSLSCTQATNNYLRVLTAESSSSVDLKLRFASSKEEAMPTSVQGRFLREDGTAVNITFKPGTGGEWTGKATFHSSGEYTLQYLVLNGEYVELDPAMWQKADIYLGMKVEVFTDSPSSFKYMPGAWEDKTSWEEGWTQDYVNRMISLAMNVVIMDDTGNPLTGLSDVTLYYPMNGSSLDERGFTSPLRWDAASGYYKGAFASKVGIFNFGRVTVGANTITNAIQAPTFRIISPEPPAYEGYVNNPYLYSTAGNIGFAVKLSNSSTATVKAVLKNLNTGRVYEDITGSYVDFTENGSSCEKWTFLIPSDGSGKQMDGNWQLMSINVWDYYDANGNYTSSEEDENGNVDEPMTIDLSAENIRMKAVVTVNTNIILPEGFDNELGKDGTAITGKFMDSYTISGLKVNISDFEGEQIQGLSEVTLKYVYGNNSGTYGGYTSSDNTLNNAKADFNVTMNMNGTSFEQAEAVTVKYAGSYSPEMNYVINGNSYRIDSSKIAFTISSVKPTVTIESFVPKGSHTTVNSSQNNVTVTSKQEGNTITIYPNASVSGSGCNKTGKLTQEPKVTLRLTGLGNADNATLTFTESSGGTVRMYSGNSSKAGTRTDAYVWDTSTGETVSRFIGYNDAGSCDDSEAAGTLTSNNNLSITSGTETYNVAVDVITIINVKP